MDEKRKDNFTPYPKETISDARRKSRQAKYLSVAALVFSVIALIIRILSVL